MQLRARAREAGRQCRGGNAGKRQNVTGMEHVACWSGGRTMTSARSTQVAMAQAGVRHKIDFRMAKRHRRGQRAATSNTPQMRDPSLPVLKTESATPSAKSPSHSTQKLPAQRTRRRFAISLDWVALIVAVVTLLLSSPLLLDRYIYRPKLVWNRTQAEQTAKRVSILWSAENRGLRAATNVRATFFTPDPEQTDVRVSDRVAYNVTKERHTIAVDFPTLPAGEGINIALLLPVEAYYPPAGRTPYIFMTKAVTSDNCVPQLLDGPFRFFAKGVHTKDSEGRTGTLF